jgi:hypothetical protein
MNTKPIRDRLFHVFSPDLAASVGLDPSQLQQVAIGRGPTLTDRQWATLARQLGIEVTS